MLQHTPIYRRRSPRITSIFSTIVLVLGVGHCQAQEFLKETFEQYGLNNIWVQPNITDSGWSQWPTDVEPCNVIAKLAHGGSKSLYVNNPGDSDYYIGTGGVTKSAEWVEAADAKVTYHRFYFYVPEEAESTQGFVLTFALKETSEPTSVGAFIGIIHDERQGTAVLATNGSGDGTVEWKPAGRWEYGTWNRVDITQHYETRTFDVQVGDQDPATDLNFRFAQTWEGNTRGEKAAASFAISPGGQIYLDDISFSTKPLPGN